MDHDQVDDALRISGECSFCEPYGGLRNTGYIKEIVAENQQEGVAAGRPDF